MRKVLLTLLVLVPVVLLHGQPCTYYPADCPDKDYANADRVNDSIERLNNPVASQEITMENNLRALTAAIMARLAEKQHWDVVELTEDGSSGYRLPDGSVAPYGNRPPHWFTITWQCIVNKDSLQQWDAWIKEFSQRRLQEVESRYAEQAAIQTGQLQAYMDSANYYGNLKAKYMEARAQQYQQAALSGNKAWRLTRFKRSSIAPRHENKFSLGKAAGTQQDACRRKRKTRQQWRCGEGPQYHFIS